LLQSIIIIQRLFFTKADHTKLSPLLNTLLRFSNSNIQTGEETFFKIKKTTKMSKVFETYAQRKGVQATALRFLLDGERINGDQTPKMLELDDQDQIDCMLEQTGGI